MALHFSFEARKLQATQERIAKQHPRKGLAFPDLESESLMKLLAQLSKLQNRVAVEHWALDRSEAELFALASHLGHCKPDLWPKVGLVLDTRWRDGYLASLWQALIAHYADAEMHRIVRRLTEQKTWNPPFDALLAPGIKGIVQSDSLLNAIHNFCQNAGGSLLEQCGQLGIGANTALAAVLWKHLLLTATRRRLVLESEESLIAALGRLVRVEDELLPAFINYLGAFEIPEWDQRQVVSKFMVPRLLEFGTLADRLLEQLAEPKKSALRERLIGRSLEIAFKEQSGDTERFQFWMQFKSNLKRQVITFRSAEAFGLDFGSFGVIEFQQHGNAAYFYHQEDFDRMVSKRDPIAAELKAFKDTYQYFFSDRDNRLTHQGDWYALWTPRIRNVLRHFNGS